MKTTQNFEAMRSRPDRAIIKTEWVQWIIDHPLKEEIQEDGRIRRWASIPVMDGRCAKTTFEVDMNDIAEIEKEVLSLPPRERERLAMAACDSLHDDADFPADISMDPEGIAIAVRRDKELESGTVEPIDHAEFKRRTGGAA